MLFSVREVRIGQNVDRDLECGLRPWAILETSGNEGTVFPNTDRPRPANIELLLRASAAGEIHRLNYRRSPAGFWPVIVRSEKGNERSAASIHF